MKMSLLINNIRERFGYNDNYKKDMCKQIVRVIDQQNNFISYRQECGPSIAVAAIIDVCKFVVSVIFHMYCILICQILYYACIICILLFLELNKLNDQTYIDFEVDNHRYITKTKSKSIKRNFVQCDYKRNSATSTCSSHNLFF